MPTKASEWVNLILTAVAAAGTVILGILKSLGM